MCGANVVPAREVRTAAMLVLLIVGN